MEIHKKFYLYTFIPVKRFVAGFGYWLSNPPEMSTLPRPSRQRTRHQLHICIYTYIHIEGYSHYSGYQGYQGYHKSEYHMSNIHKEMSVHPEVIKGLSEGYHGYSGSFTDQQWLRLRRPSGQGCGARPLGTASESCSRSCLRGLAHHR